MSFPALADEIGMAVIEPLHAPLVLQDESAGVLPSLSGIYLRELSKAARRRLLQMHFEARVGHIGGNLSALDAMLVLYHRALTGSDSFVLSKGHAAGALYITLWTKGLLDEAALATFHQDGTYLAGHPLSGWSPHIAFSTGSLGHGLSNASGLAFGKRLKREAGQVYCLTSDGEWQEGSTWEALIFASHQGLANLTVLIDANGLQGFGSTDEVASMGDLAQKIRSFAVNLQIIDGHDHAAIELALQEKTAGCPRVVLLRTVKGKGVSFMEDQMAWHYLPLTGDQYKAAMAEVERG